MLNRSICSSIIPAVGATFLLFTTGCGSMPLPPIDIDSDQAVSVKSEAASALVDVEPALVVIDIDAVPDEYVAINPQSETQDQPHQPLETAEAPPVVDEETAPQTTAQVEQQTPEVEPSVAASLPPIPSDLSAGAYVSLAINYLHEGDTNTARRALEAARDLKPLHATASMLMSHLEADPIRVLGDNHREYVLRKGDTLSELAQEYLGDSLKFFILARYNQIATPKLVEVGQRIRIPVAEDNHEPRFIPSNLEIASVVNPILKDAAELLQKKRFEQAIAKINSNKRHLSFLVEEDAKLRAQIIASASIGQAMRLQRRGRLFAAQAILASARKQFPRIIELQFHLETLEREIEIRQLTKSGEEALEHGREDEALIAFTKILELDPSQSEAKEKHDAINLDMAEDLYRRALIAQHNHNLELAITLWEKFFAIMPDNENAKVYYEKAKRLNAQLERVAQQ